MGPNTITIKANSEMTGGTFFLSETSLAARSPGPPPHTHRTITDMFYVLAGTLTVLLGDDEHTAGPGTFVCAPPGVVHTFRNDEAYRRELSASAADGPMTSEELGAIAARYDFLPVAR